MANSNYLPGTLAGLDSWADNFLAKLPTYAAAFGLSPAQVTALTNLITAQRTAYSALLAATANFHAKVDEAKVKRIDSISSAAGIRAMVKIMKASPGYTTFGGEDLGIEADTPPPIPDNLQATIKAKVLPDKTVRITCVMDIADTYNVYCRRGAETEFTFIGYSTAPKFIDARPNLNGAPEKREYKTVLVIKNAEVGTASDPTTVIVG
jgi:hypothetical protein